MEVHFTPSPRILTGLDQIGTSLNVSRRTVYRWVENCALPAMRTPAGTYVTSTSLLDLWILAVWQAQRGIKVEEPAG